MTGIERWDIACGGSRIQYPILVSKVLFVYAELGIWGLTPGTCLWNIAALLFPLMFPRDPGTRGLHTARHRFGFRVPCVDC